jgi:hypothetical protein
MPVKLRTALQELVAAHTNAMMNEASLSKVRIGSGSDDVRDSICGLRCSPSKHQLQKCSQLLRKRS